MKHEKLLHFIDRALSPSLLVGAAMDDRRRERLLVAVSYLLSAIALVAGAHSIWLVGHIHAVPVILITIGVLAALNPLLLRRGLLIKRVALVLCTELLLGLLAIAVAGYGIRAPALTWLAVVPLVAALLAGRRQGLFWGLTATAGVAALFIFEELNFDFSEPLGQGEFDLVVLLSISTLIISMAVFGWLFDYLWEQSYDEKRILLEALQQKDKLQAVGTLTAGYAHEFNNVLWVMLGNAERSMRKLDKDSPVYVLQENIRDAGLRAKERIEHLLTFAQGADAAIKDIYLPSLVNASLNVIRASLPKNINLVSDIPDEDNTIVVRGAASEIEQVLFNLCSNAVDSLRGEGVLTIRVTSVCAIPDQGLGAKRQDDSLAGRETQYGVLAISDTGCGMNDAVRSRAMDPFFTTKDVGKGSGLGLSICHGIVETFSGQMEIRSDEGAGTTVKVYLPLRAGAVVKRNRAKAATRHTQRNGD